MTKPAAQKYVTTTSPLVGRSKKADGESRDLRNLWNNFTVASEKATAAGIRCAAVIHEVPNGWPNPDGLQLIQKIVRELNSASQEMLEAEGRLNAFIVEGIVPDNLKKSVQRGERSVMIKKSVGL